jgi:hypothetical protein
VEEILMDKREVIILLIENFLEDAVMGVEDPEQCSGSDNPKILQSSQGESTEQAGYQVQSSPADTLTNPPVV